MTEMTEVQDALTEKPEVQDALTKTPEVRDFDDSVDHNQGRQAL